MLPDFPQPKRQVQKLTQQLMRRGVHQQTVLLSMVQRGVAHEGDSCTICRPDGTMERSGYDKHTVKFTIPKAELETLSLQELVKKIEDAGLEMAAKTSKSVVDELRQSTEESG